MHPGEYFLNDDPIVANQGRKTVLVVAHNSGDRPIQVGSHYHFFEVNTALKFERKISYGMRLNIPAGTAVRFEPGEEKEVLLVEYAGDSRVFGHKGWVNADLKDESIRQAALEIEEQKR